MASKDKDREESLEIPDESGSGSRPGKPGALRSTYKEMSIRGSIRSIGASSKQGSETIALGMRSMAEATRRSLEPGRNETFSQAMHRLGVVEGQLFIIHNQIVLQCYLTLLVAVFAFGSMAVFCFRGQIMAPMISGTIFLTCLVKAAQSSIQCMCIRNRRLGMNEAWLHSPAEWIPKRLQAEAAMDKNDPLRDPALIHQLAKGARKFFVVGAALILLSMGWSVLLPDNQWSLLYLGAGLVLIFFGAKNSFEVFKRRKGIHCDVFPWLMDPSVWIPELDDSKRKASAGGIPAYSASKEAGFRGFDAQADSDPSKD